MKGAEDMDDSTLIKLIKRSPERGLNVLMDEYMGLITSVVSGRLGGVCSREDVEETVSDAFIEFYRGVDNFDPAKGSVKGYLCAIARHRASAVYRKKLGEAEWVSLDDEAVKNTLADEFSVDEELLKSEQRQKIYLAIGSMASPDREIIVRKFYFHEPSKVIAEKLGMTASAVDTRTHRALKKLREILGGQEQ